MIDRFLSRTEAVTDRLAATAMFGTTVVVAVDVVARYLFRSPLLWAHDALTLYLIPGMFFLGLPGSYRRNAHIAVDFLVRRLPPFLQAVSRLLARACGIALFATFFVFGLEQAIHSYAIGEMMPGVYSFPVWPSYALVPIGSAFILLRMVEQIAYDAVGVVRGGVAVESNPPR
jgi:TRAP-type C4-dicarboxylate transport system permease small subunit